MNIRKIKFEKAIWILVSVLSLLISMVVMLDINKPIYYTLFAGI